MLGNSSDDDDSVISEPKVSKNLEAKAEPVHQTQPTTTTQAWEQDEPQGHSLPWKQQVVTNESKAFLHTWQQKHVVPELDENVESLDYDTPSAPQLAPGVQRYFIENEIFCVSCFLFKA